MRNRFTAAGLFLYANFAIASCPSGVSEYRNYVQDGSFSLNYVTAEDDGQIEFQVHKDGVDRTFQFNGTTDIGKSSLSIILAATMGGKDFSFHTGGCTNLLNGKIIVKNIRIDY